MTLISAYETWPIAPQENALYDTKAKKITQYGDVEDIDIPLILDSITLATEAGVVSRSTWVQQFFADDTVFREFLEELDQYEYRLIDRWHRALMEIAGRKDESGFITNPQVAAELFEHAKNTGQI